METLPHHHASCGWLFTTEKEMHLSFTRFQNNCTSRPDQDLYNRCCWCWCCFCPQGNGMNERINVPSTCFKKAKVHCATFLKACKQNCNLNPVWIWPTLDYNNKPDFCEAGQCLVGSWTEVKIIHPLFLLVTGDWMSTRNRTPILTKSTPTKPERKNRRKSTETKRGTQVTLVVKSTWRRPRMRNIRKKSERRSIEKNSRNRDPQRRPHRRQITRSRSMCRTRRVRKTSRNQGKKSHWKNQEGWGTWKTWKGRNTQRISGSTATRMRRRANTEKKTDTRRRYTRHIERDGRAILRETNLLMLTNRYLKGERKVC